MPRRRPYDQPEDYMPLESHVAGEDGTITCTICDADVEDGSCECATCPGSAGGPGPHAVHEDDVCERCARCEPTCCRCATCDACDERVETTCGHCDNCDDCCPCITCVECDDVTQEDNVCSVCERCIEGGCCDCQECNGCDAFHRPENCCEDCGQCSGCCRENGCLEDDDEPPARPRASGPQAALVIDRWGQRGAGPLDGAGGAVIECACPECNGMRASNRAGAAPAAASASGPPAERPNTRGYPCGVDFQRRPLVFHAGERTAVVPHTRFAAVEIEVAKAKNSRPVNEACRRWSCSVVTDGSLISGRGYELTTSPASGIKLAGLLADVCQSFADAGAVVDESCGLHVHADSRDLDHKALWRFVRIYQKVEPALYAAVTASRWTSTYCKPCGYYWKEKFREVDPNDPDWMAEAMSGYVKKKGYQKKDIDTWKVRALDGKYGARQYFGLNLGSHVHRGTIECRIHHGTTDVEKILPWTVLWAGLIQKAKDMTDADVEALPGEPVRPEEMDRWDKVAFSTLSQLAPTAAVRTWLRTRRRQFMDLAKAPGAWSANAAGEI